MPRVSIVTIRALASHCGSPCVHRVPRCAQACRVFAPVVLAGERQNGTRAASAHSPALALHVVTVRCCCVDGSDLLRGARPSRSTEDGLEHTSQARGWAAQSARRCAGSDTTRSRAPVTSLPLPASCLAPSDGTPHHAPTGHHAASSPHPRLLFWTPRPGAQASSSSPRHGVPPTWHCGARLSPTLRVTPSSVAAALVLPREHPRTHPQRASA